MRVDAELVEAVVVSAAMVVGRVLVINLLALIFVFFPRKQPILTPQFLKGVSTFVTKLLLPCFSFNIMSKNVTATALLESKFYILWIAVQITIACIISTVFMYMFRCPRWFRRVYIIASTFQNVASLPLLLMETLATEEPLASYNVSLDRIYGLGFMLNIVWSIMFFGMADPWMSGADGQRLSEGAPTATQLRPVASDVCDRAPTSWCRRFVSKAWQSVVTFLSSATQIGMLAGILVGVIPPVRDLLHSPEGELRWLAGGLEQVGRPVVTLTALVMGASLGLALKELDMGSWVRCMKTRLELSEIVVVGDNVKAADDHHVQTGAIEQTWKPMPMAGNGGDTGDDDRSKRTWVDVVIDERLLTETERGTEGDAVPPGEQAAERLSLKMCIGFVLCKMLIIPGALMGIVYTVGPMILPATDEATHLIMYYFMLINTFMPTANMVVVVLQRSGQRRAAEQLSVLSMAQYLCAIVTFFAFVTLSGMLVTDEGNRLREARNTSAVENVTATQSIVSMPSALLR